MVVSAVYLPPNRPQVPEPGPFERELFGWSRLLHSPSSGVRVFRGALQGEQVVPALSSGFDWAVRGIYRTAWAVQPRCHCSYSHGSGQAVGPQTGERSWKLLRGLWRTVAPLMEPWCSAGEVPTSANLNYYGSLGSRVRWHSDDEDLFGKWGLFGEAGGVQTHCFNEFWGFRAFQFKWKPGPSPDSDASSSWLHHGDLLVMDGRCQDEYLHCTDPLQGEERVNITFRCLRNHVPRCPLVTGVMCCLPTRDKGSSASTNAGFFLPGFLLLVSLLVLVGWGFSRVVALIPINLGSQGRSLCCTRPDQN